MSKKNYFRFIPSNAPQLDLFCRKVIPNYLSKTLQVEMTDSIDGHVHEWVESLTGNVSFSSKLELHNEEGNSTIVIDFERVELLDHEFNVSYDDDDDDQRTHSLLFSYQTMNRKNWLD